MSSQHRSAKNFNRPIERERDGRLWWQCAAGIVVGIFLAVGFGYAAQQHFAAHEQSRENVKLQRERDRLRAEREKLECERETALERTELEKRAQKIGMQPREAAQIVAPDFDSSVKAAIAETKIELPKREDAEKKQNKNKTKIQKSL